MFLNRFPSGGPEAAEEARRALTDRRRDADEQRDQHGLSGQQAYEARLAAEEQRRQDERDRLHEGHVAREAERWQQIGTLRTMRDQIANERHDLTAQLHASVESGDLESAVAAQARLAVLGPVDGIVVRRLSALGVEK